MRAFLAQLKFHVLVGLYGAQVPSIFYSWLPWKLFHYKWKVIESFYFKSDNIS